MRSLKFSRAMMGFAVGAGEANRIKHANGRRASRLLPFDLTTLRIVLPYAALMTMVGLPETFLTLNLTDDVTATRGRPNDKERPRVHAWLIVQCVN
ncbi:MULTISPECIES: hypothetical protein [Paraburkholderia]